MARVAHLQPDRRAARAVASGHERPRRGDGGDVDDRGQRARVQAAALVEVRRRTRHPQADAPRALVERDDLQLPDVSGEQAMTGGWTECRERGQQRGLGPEGWLGPPAVCPLVTPPPPAHPPAPPPPPP